MNSPRSGLNPCISYLNCAFLQKEFKNADRAFNKLTKIAENLPRTTVIERSDNYWKGVCRSLIFRFPDDIEILKADHPKGVLQIKSASRFGASDLGVNQRRINYLLKKLEER